MNNWMAQLGWELRKLFARKRTYIGFAAFAGTEFALLMLIRLPKVRQLLGNAIEQTGYSAGEFISGITLALLMLVYTIALLGALYLALVSGDIVSKEVEDGTMRMTLCRPVSRGQVLGTKVCASVLYTMTLVLFIGVTALLAGFSYGGAGGLFVVAPMEGVYSLFSFEDGFCRYLGALPLLTMSLLPITCLGLFFSCLNMKPAAATIVTLSVFLIDKILASIPYFESLRDWFFTARMGAWIQVFQYRIPWETMVQDYLWLFGMDATLIVLGWIAFEVRDFKA